MEKLWINSLDYKYSYIYSLSTTTNRTIVTRMMSNLLGLVENVKTLVKLDKNIQQVTTQAVMTTRDHQPQLQSVCTKLHLKSKTYQIPR